MSSTGDLKSGDVLITTGGNFVIIRMKCHSDNTEGLFGWCAVHVGDEHPLEIQYMVRGDNSGLLIKEIAKNVEVLTVASGKVALSGI